MFQLHAPYRAVPLFAHGTVATILDQTDEVDVVFDKPFGGGTRLGGRCGDEDGTC